MQDHPTDECTAPAKEDDFIRLGQEQIDYPAEPFRNPPKPMMALAVFERTRREDRYETSRELEDGMQERRDDGGGTPMIGKYPVFAFKPEDRDRFIELLRNPPDSTLALASTRPGGKKGFLKLNKYRR
ncbi:MAG TPA: hypothetical protein VGZ00_05405 [Candidatus Baltobacteraceae bacterium]|nr:hypothetical protein [Candidatus Baltobacteraceae bacterium]